MKRIKAIVSTFFWLTTITTCIAAFWTKGETSEHLLTSALTSLVLQLSVNTFFRKFKKLTKTNKLNQEA